MEIKSEKGKKTKGQIDFAQELASAGVPVYEVRTPEEALRIIGVMDG
jgi:hypothetical protein